MGKANLKFSNIGNTDYLIITWSLFATPLAEIGRQVYSAPHPQRSLTVPNLDNAMHRFSFFQSVNGVTLGTRLLDMDIDTGIPGEYVIYDYVVGRGQSGVSPNWADPVAGASLVTDDRLKGSKFYIERRAFGKLLDSEVTKDYTLGTWQIVGNTFENDDTWFSVVQIAAPATNPLPSSDYIDVYTLAASENFVTAMHRKLVEVTTSANTPVLSFPAFASIPKTKVLINTHSMTGRYLTLAFSGAETAKFMGLNKNKITLGKGEEIELLFTGTACKVMRYEGDYRKLGSINFGRGVELNTLPLDGSLFNIADYPRLYLDFINLLPVAQIKTMAVWAESLLFGAITEYPYKGFFAVDTGAGTFRVPDFRNRAIRSLKLDGTDATRFTDFPGGFQMDDTKPHTHTKTHNYTFRAGGGNPTEGVAGGVFGGAGGSFVWTSDANSGQETIMRNIGLIPQIII